VSAIDPGAAQTMRLASELMEARETIADQQEIIGVQQEAIDMLTATLRSHRLMLDALAALFEARQAPSSRDKNSL
jgi:hypothetical protein